MENLRGWVARYEIWSVDENPMRKFVTDLKLPESEVHLQMVQSIGLHKTKSNGFSFSLQFPTAISASLRHFAVLRTVYSLSQDNLGLQVNIESEAIPIEHDSHMSSAWKPSAYPDLSDNYFFFRRTPYFYWTKLSADGRFITIIDRKHVALYSVHGGGPLQVQLESSTRFERKRADEDPGTIDVMFHPNAPLVAFTFSSSVYLWAFTNGERKLDCIELKHHQLTLLAP